MTSSSDTETLASGSLTLEDAARMMRDAVKDKSYRAFPLGQEAGHYLRSKRKRLTRSSYIDYESCLDKLARHFLDLELASFEPRVDPDDRRHLHGLGHRSARGDA